MFINNSQLKQLRENARNGDLRAKSILNKQYSNQDFSGELNEYFAAPKQELTGLDKFLADNNIDKNSPDYDETVEMYNNEVGAIQEEHENHKIYDEVTKLIQKYDELILELANNSDSYEILAVQQMKSDLIRHLSELKKIVEKNEEKM